LPPPCSMTGQGSAVKSGLSAQLPPDTSKDLRHLAEMEGEYYVTLTRLSAV